MNSTHHTFVRAVVYIAALVVARIGKTDDHRSVTRPICMISMRGASGAAYPPLECVDGRVFIEGTREREPTDAASRWPFKSKERCIYFELSRREGIVTIRSLGPGELDVNNAFVPAKTNEKDASRDGFLTVDRTVSPPVVKLTRQTEKDSYWKISRDKGTGVDFSIVNVEEGQKEGSLFPDNSRPIVVDGNGDTIDLFKPAIISFEHKAAFWISIQNGER